jgi:hypothetical protein
MKKKLSKTLLITLFFCSKLHIGSCQIKEYTHIVFITVMKNDSIDVVNKQINQDIDSFKNIKIFSDINKYIFKNIFYTNKTKQKELLDSFLQKELNILKSTFDSSTNPLIVISFNGHGASEKKKKENISGMYIDTNTVINPMEVIKVLKKYILEKYDVMLLLNYCNTITNIEKIKKSVFHAQKTNEDNFNSNKDIKIFENSLKYYDENTNLFSSATFQNDFFGSIQKLSKLASFKQLLDIDSAKTLVDIKQLQKYIANEFTDSDSNKTIAKNDTLAFIYSPKYSDFKSLIYVTATDEIYQNLIIKGVFNTVITYKQKDMVLSDFVKAVYNYNPYNIMSPKMVTCIFSSPTNKENELFIKNRVVFKK